MSLRLITSPDFVYEYKKNCLLVCPSSESKQQIQSALESIDVDIDIYLYTHESDVEWLIKVIRMVDNIFIDIDNCDSIARDLTSYMLGFSNTYWLTKGENISYTIINKNRLYDAKSFIEIAHGVTFEQAKI